MTLNYKYWLSLLKSKSYANGIVVSYNWEWGVETINFYSKLLWKWVDEASFAHGKCNYPSETDFLRYISHIQCDYHSDWTHISTH